MDLSECMKKGFIRKCSKNQELIASLREMAEIKEETVRQAELTERNVSAYLSMGYDSLREIMEAVWQKNRFYAGKGINK
ncbi:MAG: hypothetical protein KKF44_10180 [Nanoarchaeota archaeon]|nr:hypothetical protein [Nanoarchaeota archaeon]